MGISKSHLSRDYLNLTLLHFLAAQAADQIRKVLQQTKIYFHLVFNQKDCQYFHKILR